MSKTAPSQKTSSELMAHSSLVGGSTADRRIGCPASYQEEQKVPEHIKNKSSKYADEGTGLHAAMQHIMEENIFEDDLETEVLGREFEGIMMTQKLIDTAILPCMDYIEILMDNLADEGEFRFEVETRCAMPGIPGAFGTTDFIWRTDKRSGIIDYKFGEGVPVAASYREDDGTVRGNSQLLYYGRAALDTLPHMFEDDPNWPVELHILQPRAPDGYKPFSMYETTVAGLETFRQTLIVAIDKAQAPNPQLRKGPWCRFASCKTVCPLHTGALLDATKLAVLKKQEPTAFDYGQHLDMLLEIADLAEDIIKDVRAHAITHLEAGQPILDQNGEPSWKLVPRRAVEKVVDETGMVRHAIGLGLAEDDAYEPRSAKSPAQLGKALEPLMDTASFKTKKDREAEARRQLREFTASISSGNTLARADDKRPDVTPTPQLVATVAKKLAALAPK